MLLSSCTRDIPGTIHTKSDKVKIKILVVGNDVNIHYPGISNAVVSKDVSSSNGVQIIDSTDAVDFTLTLKNNFQYNFNPEPTVSFIRLSAVIEASDDTYNFYKEGQFKYGDEISFSTSIVYE